MKSKHMSRLFAAALGVVTVYVASSASAVTITFVKATLEPGAINTTLADGSAMVEGTDCQDSAAADLWFHRTHPIHDNSDDAKVFLSNSSSALGDAPRMRTTITGLTLGEEYNVYVFFASNVGNEDSDWRVRAGLDDLAGDLPLFSRFEGSTLVPVGSPDVDFGSTAYEEHALKIRQGSLGTEVADVSGNIYVYIDDDAPVDTTDHRTWYTGVGYSLVPEPSSWILLTIGLTAVGIAPRRRHR